MRRRIAVLGVTDDAIAALPRLASRPDLEIACVYDADAVVQRRRLALHEPSAAALLQKLLTDDPAALDGLELVPAHELAALVEDESCSGRDATSELVDAFGEIADAAELIADPAALFPRLLDAALAATGASGGSLLLVDPAAEVLRVAAATGVERELWPKIALPLGRGIAGRAWAEGRPLFVRGRADPAYFELACERGDVADSACIPLVRSRGTHGVLCLHHATRSDLFTADDLERCEAIGASLARVLAQAAAQRDARESAERAEITAQVQGALATPGPREQRLVALCRVSSAYSGGGIATLWWNEEEGALRMVATSLPGGELGAAARLVAGEGVDGRAALDRVPLFLCRDGLLAYAALPLLDGATLLGVLSIQIGTGTGTGPGASEPALRALADAAAQALGRDLALARARDHAARGDAAHEAAARLLAERDPDRIAAQLATSAALLLDAEQAVVRLFDAEHQSYRVRARSSGADPLDDALLALDRRAAREALRTRASVDGPGDEDGSRAWLVVPILAGRRVLGTLGLYDKRPPAPPRFDRLDRESAARLAGYAARALVDAIAIERPSPARRLLAASAFERRLDEEIARARAGGAAASFLLVTSRVENASELGPEATRRVLRRMGAALALELRAFDAAAQTGPDTLSALLPEPGGAPAERVARLARAVSERAASEAETPLAALAFGHALHPDDGETRPALQSAAAAPRIRML